MPVLTRQHSLRNMPESQIVSPSASIAAISWTGGKDCNLALLHAWRHPSLRVTSLVCFRPKGKPFLAHPIPFMEAQADALGLPLFFVDIPEGTTDYMKTYAEGLVQFKAEHGVSVIVTGDMDLVGTMERNWMQRCCEGVDGMRAHLPLWRMDRSRCLNTLLEEGFSVVFTCVKSPYFDESWIGRRLDHQTVKELKRMAFSGALSEEDARNGLKPLDVGEERGEYHTMCIDGPLYKHQVRVEMADEPQRQDQISKTKWKGNIHNADRLWTISVKSYNDHA